MKSCQDLINLAEESHYPEDDLLVSELMKVLTRQSKDF
jgi:hypothetical protein